MTTGQILKVTPAKVDYKRLVDRLLALVDPHFREAILSSSPDPEQHLKHPPFVTVSLLVHGWDTRRESPRSYRLSVERPLQTAYYNSLEDAQRSLMASRSQQSGSIESSTASIQAQQLIQCGQYLAPRLKTSLMTLREQGNKHVLEPGFEVKLEFRQGSLFSCRITQIEKNPEWLGWHAGKALVNA